MSSALVEDYDSNAWRYRVRAILQAKLVEVMMPPGLDEVHRDRWAMVWLQRYAVPFAHWLDDVPGRSKRLARRLHQGTPFTREELRALALKLENQ